MPGQNPEMQESHSPPHIFPRVTNTLPVPLPLDQIVSQVLTVAMKEKVSVGKKEGTTSEV